MCTNFLTTACRSRDHTGKWMDPRHGVVGIVLIGNIKCVRIIGLQNTIGFFFITLWVLRWRWCIPLCQRCWWCLIRMSYSMPISVMSQHSVFSWKCHITLRTSRRHRRDSVKHVLLLQLLRPKWKKSSSVTIYIFQWPYARLLMPSSKILIYRLSSSHKKCI